MKLKRPRVSVRTGRTSGDLVDDSAWPEEEPDLCIGDGLVRPHLQHYTVYESLCRTPVGQLRQGSGTAPMTEAQQKLSRRPPCLDHMR